MTYQQMNIFNVRLIQQWRTAIDQGQQVMIYIQLV